MRGDPPGVPEVAPSLTRSPCEERSVKVTTALVGGGVRERAGRQFRAADRSPNIATGRHGFPVDLDNIYNEAALAEQVGGV